MTKGEANYSYIFRYEGSPNTSILNFRLDENVLTLYDSWKPETVIGGLFIWDKNAQLRMMNEEPIKYNEPQT